MLSMLASAHSEGQGFARTGVLDGVQGTTGDLQPFA